MVNDTLKVGMIGMVSPYLMHYSAALSRTPGVQVVAAAHLGCTPEEMAETFGRGYLSQHPQTIEGYRDLYGVTLYENPMDMLQSENLDAVCLTGEESTRTGYALSAIELGVHALMPKPWAYTVADAEKLISAAKKAGVVLWCSLPYRSGGIFPAVRERIDRGDIGVVLSARAMITHHISLYAWKRDPAKTAGGEFEFGFYVFDALNWMMGGRPVSVYGVGTNLENPEAPFYIDNGKAIISYLEGRMASADLYMSAKYSYPSMNMEILGTAAGLMLLPGSSRGERILRYFTKDGTRDEILTGTNSNQEEARAFAEACMAGKPLVAFEEEAREALHICAGYKRSHQSGEVISLPLAS